MVIVAILKMIAIMMIAGAIVDVMITIQVSLVVAMMDGRSQKIASEDYGMSAMINSWMVSQQQYYYQLSRAIVVAVIISINAVVVVAVNGSMDEH